MAILSKLKSKQYETAIEKIKHQQGGEGVYSLKKKNWNLSIVWEMPGETPNWK